MRWLWFFLITFFIVPCFANGLWPEEQLLCEWDDIHWARTIESTVDNCIITAYGMLHDDQREIVLQKIDSNGNQVWTTPPSFIVPNIDIDQIRFIGTSNHLFAIVWNDPDHVYCQYIDQNGQLVGSSHVVFDTTNLRKLLLIADIDGGIYIGADRGNEYLVAHFADGAIRQEISIPISREELSTDLIRLRPDGEGGFFILYPSIHEALFAERYDPTLHPYWDQPLQLAEYSTFDPHWLSNLVIVEDRVALISINRGSNVDLLRIYPTGMLQVYTDILQNLPSEISNYICLTSNQTGFQVGVFYQPTDSNRFLGSIYWLDYQCNLISQPLHLPQDSTAINCQNVRMYSDATGGIAIAWNLAIRGESDVFRVQYINRERQICWTENGLSLDQEASHFTVVSTEDRFFVVWDVADQMTYIKYQIIDIAGNTVLPGTGNSLQAKGTYRVSDNINIPLQGRNIICWTGARPGSYSTEFFYRIIDSSGVISPRSGLPLNNHMVMGKVLAPVAITSAGKGYLAYINQYNDNISIYTQRFQEDGTPEWSDSYKAYSATLRDSISDLSLTEYNGSVYLWWYSHTSNLVMVNKISNEGSLWERPSEISLDFIPTQLSFVGLSAILANGSTCQIIRISENGDIQIGWDRYFITDFHYNESTKRLTFLSDQDDLFLFWAQLLSETQETWKLQRIHPDGSAAWEVPVTISLPVPSHSSSIQVNGEYLYITSLFNGMDYSNIDFFKIDLNHPTAQAQHQQLIHRTSFIPYVESKLNLDGQLVVVWGENPSFSLQQNSILAIDCVNPANIIGQTLISPSMGYQHQPSLSFGVECYSTLSWIEEQPDLFSDTPLSNQLVCQLFNFRYTDNQNDIDVPTPLSLKLFPNPFSRSICIEATTKDSQSDIEYRIFNMKGQLVKSWSEKTGNKSVQTSWDGTDQLSKRVGSGVYLLQLKQGPIIKNKKMLFLKT